MEDLYRGLESKSTWGNIPGSNKEVKNMKDNPWRDFKKEPPPNEEAILLVWLEEPLLFGSSPPRLRFAAWHPNVQTIGYPKIQKWKYFNEFYPEGEG